MTESSGSAGEVADEVARLYPAVYRRFKAPTRGRDGADLTPRMLSVLHHLTACGPLTVGEQATHLGLSKAATSELVDRLEAKGLVGRMRDDRDRRRVFVWLTPAGRAQTRVEAAGLRDCTHAKRALDGALRGVRWTRRQARSAQPGPA